MSQTQKLNFRLLKALLLQLRHYGLNPTDWRVCRSSSVAAKELSLIHRDDSEFVFRGQIKHSGQSMQWESLMLVSL